MDTFQVVSVSICIIVSIGALYSAINTPPEEYLFQITPGKEGEVRQRMIIIAGMMLVMSISALLVFLLLG